MFNLHVGNRFSKPLNTGFAGQGKNSAQLKNTAGSPSFSGQSGDSLSLSNTVKPKRLGLAGTILAALGLTTVGCDQPGYIQRGSDGGENPYLLMEPTGTCDTQACVNNSDISQIVTIESGGNTEAFALTCDGKKVPLSPTPSNPIDPCIGQPGDAIKSVTTVKTFNIIQENIESCDGTKTINATARCPIDGSQSLLRKAGKALSRVKRV